MREIPANAELIASCGLYCGACGAYLKERCGGCAGNTKATWCRIRSCCMGRKISSCAECVDFTEPVDCKKFNNLMSKIFGLIFRSDREACIQQIKKNGRQVYAEEMAAKKIHTVKK
jgi:hypothetical protein